jgi:hypothetical protein
MAIPNPLLPPAEPVATNPYLLHAELVKVVRNLQPVVQAKMTASQKPLHVVPHAGPERSEIFNVPGQTSRLGTFLPITKQWNTLLFNGT